MTAKNLSVSPICDQFVLQCWKTEVRWLVNNVGLQALRSSDLLCVCLLLLRECRHQVFYRAWLIHLPLVVGTKKNKRKQMDKQKKKKQSHRLAESCCGWLWLCFGFCLLLCCFPSRRGVIGFESSSEVADQRGLLCFVFSDSPLYLYTVNGVYVCVREREREKEKKCVCIYTCMCVWVCVCAGERGRPIVPSYPLCCCRYWLFTSV